MRYGTNRTTSHSTEIVIEHFLYAGTVLDTGDEVEPGKLNLALWTKASLRYTMQVLSHDDVTKKTQIRKGWMRVPGRAG